MTKTKTNNPKVSKQKNVETAKSQMSTSNKNIEIKQNKTIARNQKETLVKNAKNLKESGNIVEANHVEPLPKVGHVDNKEIKNSDTPQEPDVKKNVKKNKRQLDKSTKYKLLFLNIITFYIFQFYVNHKIKKNVRPNEDVSPQQSLKQNQEKHFKHSNKVPFDIQEFVGFLGGSENIKNIESTLNSLQVYLRDKTLINKDAIKGLGAKGFVISKEKISIVFGDYSMSLNDELKRLLKK